MQTKYFPDWRSYPASRLFCLDVMRGLVIIYLTVISYGILSQGIFRVWKPNAWLQWFFRHQLTAFAAPGHVPTGWGLQDFAQPLFIFVTGAAVTFAMRRRLGADGRPLPGFWRHVLGRVAMLWTLGMLIRGLLRFSLARDFFFYADTLHTISVAYLGAVFSLLIPRKLVRLVLALGAIAVFGVVQAVFGDYSQNGNISRIIDEAVFGALGGHGKDFCYLLTTIPWMAMGVIGSLASGILLEDKGPWARAGKLSVCGLCTLALGWTLQIWIPPIRYIYTVSFIFTTQGYAMLILAFLYAVTDIWQIRRGTGLVLLFGQCSLAAWMLANFFNGGVNAVANRLTEGMPVLLGGDTYMPLVRSIAYALVLIVLVSMWYRLRTAERKVAKAESAKGAVQA